MSEEKPQQEQPKQQEQQQQKGKKEAPLEEPSYWAPRNEVFNRALERYNKELEGLFPKHTTHTQDSSVASQQDQEQHKQANEQQRRRRRSR